MVNLVPKAESMDSTSSQIATDNTPASSSSFLDINYEAQTNVANAMKCDVMQSTDSLTFFNETLELSQEDIQKTLSANMPINTNNAPIRSISGLNEMSTTIRETALRPSDYIDDCCDDGHIDVGPSTVHDDDVFVNLDAFDMFVEFPELDLDTKASISCPTDGNDISIDIAAATGDGGGGERIHLTEQHLETESNSRLLSSDIENHNELNDLNRESAQQTLSATNFSSSELSETTMESRNDLFNISDFSPEWAYPEGGIKVLVTGPWNQNSNYTVLFDSFPVPTTIVQSGVLRCYCPAHEVGLVTLQVACDGYVISNSCIFEYKSPINAESGTECNGTTNISSNDDNLYKLTLYNRLESIEERMQIKMEPSDSVCASSVS